MENRETVSNCFVQRLLYSMQLKRFIFFFLSDILIITASLYLAFALAFDFTLKQRYEQLILSALPVFLIVKLSAFALFRLYRITWRYVGINELLDIVSATVVSESVLMILILVRTPPNSFLLQSLSTFPRSAFVIDGLISLLLLFTVRVSKRIYLEILHRNTSVTRGHRAIVIGAGNTGEMIVRDMARRKFSDFYPVGFLDDDRNVVGTYVHGLKVIGTTDELRTSISRLKIEAIIIAIPNLNHRVLRKLYESARAAGVQIIKVVPKMYNFDKPHVDIQTLEDISMEDLIGRQEINIHYEGIKEFLKDKTVLITGAGGSIGSEVVMQVCEFEPRRVILFDVDETELHNMQLKLNRVYPYLLGRVGSFDTKEGITYLPRQSGEDGRARFVVGDIRDEEKVNAIFARFKPEIVFHSAAYKHVPMMEYNPEEAVKVNIFGTYIVAKASVNYGVEKFIMISSDKAVRPTSIMGTTKRMAEYICKAFNEVGKQDQGYPTKTEFISVRFGNVLGSRGSVLPLFLDQLRHFGPLTITHKDMRRYFMTVQEAVSLVLQASVIGKGGEVLVLDMGEPVRIVDLAEELIRLHGLKPYDDIDIKVTGIRPGENLFEDILTSEEGTSATKHEKIFIAKDGGGYSVEVIDNILQEFNAALKESTIANGKPIRELLNKYVRPLSEM